MHDSITITNPNPYQEDCFVVESNNKKGLIYGSLKLPIENDDFVFDNPFIFYTKGSKKGLIGYRGIVHKVLIEPNFSEITILNSQLMDGFHVLLLKLDDVFAIASSAELLFQTSKPEETKYINTIVYKRSEINEKENNLKTAT